MSMSARERERKREGEREREGGREMSTATSTTNWALVERPRHSRHADGTGSILRQDDDGTAPP